MSACTGLPISVSRGTPVSSETSGDAYRKVPAALWTEISARTLPARSLKRSSHGSGAMPLPSTAFRWRLGAPTLVLSAAERRALARQIRQGPIQLACGELPEAEALEPVALVRGVEGIRPEREPAHDRGHALVGQHGQERQRPAQPHEGGPGAAGALERVGGELQGRVVDVEERGLGE